MFPTSERVPLSAIREMPMEQQLTYFVGLAVKAGLAPAKPATHRTLLRRLTVDLCGLPPTPEFIDTFLEDDEAQRD